MNKARQTMNKVTKDILTDANGVDFSLIRLVGASFAIVYMFLSVVAFFTGKPFDMSAYGVGAAAVAGAMGVAIKLDPSEKKDGNGP